MRMLPRSNRIVVANPHLAYVAIPVDQLLAIAVKSVIRKKKWFKNNDDTFQVDKKLKCWELTSISFGERAIRVERISDGMCRISSIAQFNHIHGLLGKIDTHLCSEVIGTPMLLFQSGREGVRECIVEFLNHSIELSTPEDIDSKFPSNDPGAEPDVAEQRCMTELFRIFSVSQVHFESENCILLKDGTGAGDPVCLLLNEHPVNSYVSLFGFAQGENAFGFDNHFDLFFCISKVVNFLCRKQGLDFEI